MADEPKLGQKPRWNHRIAWFLVALLAVFLLLPMSGIRWSGGFPSTEFRLRFVDAAGEPVPGVRLDVFTQGGGRSYLYPVEEFVPDNPVVSDADGRMTFRHYGTLEFSGQDVSNILGITYRYDKAPQYDCVFFLDDREVHRIRFNKLMKRDGTGFETVERPRIRADWANRENQRLAKVDELEWNAFFDLNGDGRIDREEGVARNYFFRVTEMDDRPANSRYDVAERTIVLPSR